MFLDRKFEEPKRTLVDGNVVIKRLPIKKYTNIMEAGGNRKQILEGM